MKLKSKIYLIFLTILICRSSKTIQYIESNINFKGIENGLMICRQGNGFFSDYFRKYASKEQKYSHIGIIAIEKDTAFVYHSEASELTGVGQIKREQLNSFLKNIKVYDFFRFSYPDSVKTKVLNSVKHYYQVKTPFDLNFDSFNDNELYCSELIATSINKTLNKEEIKPNLILNKKKLYALDDIYLNEHVKKIELKVVSK